MDEVGQIGPNIDGYEDDVINVMVELERARSVYLRLVDRGTRINLTLTPIEAVTMLGGRRPDGVDRSGHWVNASVDGQSSYWIDLSQRIGASYVHEKLYPRNATDAAMLAEFLNELDPRERQATLTRIR